MQTIVDACGCHASKQSDSRDRGLISSLPITYCANSLLYVDSIHGLPRFGGYDSCLVVTCGLSRFTRVFPCNKKITGEQTVKMFVEQWFEPYGAPKQVHSDEDVRIRSDTGWYKRVPNALNVEVITGVPYTHTSNPLCERQNRVVEQNLRILMKQDRTKDWVLKRYPEPMAHGPEACEPSHPLWPMARRPASRHTRAEAGDTGYPCSLTRGIWNPISNQ